METVIPFGKYKRRTVEAVANIDPGYLYWLHGQDWSWEKYRVMMEAVCDVMGLPVKGGRQRSYTWESESREDINDGGQLLEQVVDAITARGRTRGEAMAIIRHLLRKLPRDA